MRKRIAILIITLVFALSFSGCRQLGSAIGKAIKESLNSEEQESFSEPESVEEEFSKPEEVDSEEEFSEEPSEEYIADSDTENEIIRAAYLTALRNYKDNNLLPDGRQVNRPDDGHVHSVEFDQFSICDVDKDGYNELIIYYLTSSTGYNMTYIYQYKPDTKDYLLELETYSSIRFYTQEYITTAENYYEYRDTEPICPFCLYQYNADTDTYDLKFETEDMDSVSENPDFMNLRSDKQNGRTKETYYDYEPFNEAGLVYAMPTEDFEDSFATVNHYGFDAEGYSFLNFVLISGTAKDCGDYYEVEAVFENQYYVSSDLQIGQTQTIYGDGFGIPLTVKKVSEYEYAKVWEDGYENEYAEYYTYGDASDKDKEWPLWRDSDDQVCAPVYRGKLRVRKDATVGVPIVDQYWTVNKYDMAEEYNYSYNGVNFDDEGYVTELLMFGD